MATPETTPRIVMPTIVAGESESTAHHNQALAQLDAMVWLTVLERDTQDPPGAVAGDAYIIGDTPTGEWDGHAGEIAFFFADQWNYIVPAVGFGAWIQSESVFARFTGSIWESETGESVFEAYKTTSSQSITGSGDNITWNADVRKNAIFSHSTSVNPEQITVGEPGDYDIHAELTLDYQSGASWQKVTIEITVNGTQVPGSITRGAVDTNSDQLTFAVRRTVSLGDGDIIRIKGTLTAGGGTVQALADACRIHIRRV